MVFIRFAPDSTHGSGLSAKGTAPQSSYAPVSLISVFPQAGNLGSGDGEECSVGEDGNSRPTPPVTNQELRPTTTTTAVNISNGLGWRIGF